MAAAMRSAISACRKPKMVNSSPYFVDEDLNSVQASGIPEEFRKLSRFLPVIVNIPKSVASHKSNNKDELPNQRVACGANMEMLSCPPDTTKAWFRSPGVSDIFEFGVVTGCFSTMEIRRDGQARGDDLQGVQNSLVSDQESVEGDFTQRTSQ